MNYEIFVRYKTIESIESVVSYLENNYMTDVTFVQDYKLIEDLKVVRDYLLSE